MGSKPPISISVPKEELPEFRQKAKELIVRLIAMGADVTSQSGLFRQLVRSPIVEENGAFYIKVRVK
jgi:hypothetical protein